MTPERRRTGRTIRKARREFLRPIRAFTDALTSRQMRRSMRKIVNAVQTLAESTSSYLGAHRDG